MSQQKSQLESILFLATRPMKKKELIKALGVTDEQFLALVEEVKKQFNTEISGIQLAEHNEEYQFMSAPQNAELVEKVFQTDLTGELTKPALETLTIIAYRGPITKPELELIRGINCSMIIRNLLMRGLIIEKSGKEEMMPAYACSMEFLQFLGITSVNELPSFDELHSHQLLEELLKSRQQSN